MLRYMLAVGAALCSLASAHAISVPHRTPVHHTAPRHSIHRSTPHRVSRPAPKPHVAAKPKTVRAPVVTRRPVTRNVNKSVVVNKNMTINRFSVNSFARPRSSYRHRHYPTRYNTFISRTSFRSSRFSRRHIHRRNNNLANVVRGVVSNTSGAAANGSIQIKVVKNNTNRFQYGVAVTAPNNAPTKDIPVANATRYIKVTSAQGGMKNVGFKDVAPGEAVVIVMPKVANQAANLVEIFPLK